MSEADAFQDLVRRVRARDERAAAELVERYEPAIRRAARVRLTDPALRRILDSTDISQSVLASFFARVALGQYELDKPQQLLRLLVAMTQKKVAFQARRQHAARRDIRRTATVSSNEVSIADRGPSPSQQVAWRELLDKFRERLSEDERWLVDQRALSRDWAQIALESGTSPDALRKRLARAVDRVARQLRLDWT
jgi:DNA-directed RNA polymerase specialized sigma24 family protein